jgi:hypothetical protein
MMAMAVERPEKHDWTYRAARKRMVRVGRAQLRHHAAAARMDNAGNRIVHCRCGWTGNALGWSEHLDNVVHQALSSGSAA